MANRILLVDDDPNVLQGFKRHLRKDYDMELAVGGHEAIEIFKTKGPFAVVVSDMQMPEMTGLELLSRLQKLDDHTVRIMLTGNADQKTAVDAVNEGNIFRFLSKPCPSESLAKTLDAALRQHQLVTAEAELLSKTLAGSVRMLTQVLSLAMPKAFGMCQEARTLARGIAEILSVGPMWQVEMAAMLMRVGCVSLPEEVLEKYLCDEPLSAEEAKLVAGTPQLGHSLLSAIPRLQDVARLVATQTEPPVAATPPAARILKVVGDFQRFRCNGSPFTALKRLRIGTGYDVSVVDALDQIVSQSCEIRSVTVAELEEGMIFEENVQDKLGRNLIVNGTEVHEALIQKLVMLQRSGSGVREPIRVQVANLGTTPVLATASA